MKIIRKPILFFIVTAFSILFFSCDEEETHLKREILFSMPIGKMEDQLFVQQYKGIDTSEKNRIFMKDGFIFISNGESSKVMEFNSFGDLVTLFYNKDRNPAPVLLNNEKNENGDITRAAYSYPLNEPGEIVRTKNGDLLVEDIITEQRREFDSEINAELDRIILRFDQDGNLISFLGQEGLGGTPFSYIQGLYCNDDDEIIVVTKNSVGWRIFWYTYKSDPLYKIDFRNDLLPMDEDSEELSIENIIPDVSKRKIYLKIDYYTDDGDGAIKFTKSIIYAYNIDTMDYDLKIELPRNVVKSDQPVIFDKDEHQYLYEFAGVARGPSFFLLSPYESYSYRLTVLSEDGAVNGNVLIDFSDQDIFFKDYYVSPEGIFSALVCKEYEADVVWWRSDRLVEESRNEGFKLFKNAGD
ncbi:MAG: hypothetical protein PQJ46_04715 [Spirochaetales bacterium]|nr:hypothetical protein [Spirochaetales bacterium]